MPYEKAQWLQNLSTACWSRFATPDKEWHVLLMYLKKETMMETQYHMLEPHATQKVTGVANMVG